MRGVLTPAVGDSFSGRGVFVGSQTNCLPSDPTGYNGAYMDGWRRGNSVCLALDTAEMHMDGRGGKTGALSPEDSQHSSC